MELVNLIRFPNRRESKSIECGLHACTPKRYSAQAGHLRSIMYALFCVIIIIFMA